MSRDEQTVKQLTSDGVEARNAGNFENAEELLRRALDSANDRQWPDVALNLADTIRRDGRVQEAQELLDVALAKANHAAEEQHEFGLLGAVLHQQARLNLQSGQDDAALACITQAHNTLQLAHQNGQDADIAAVQLDLASILALHSSDWLRWRARLAALRVLVLTDVTAEHRKRALTIVTFAHDPGHPKAARAFFGE